MRTFIVSLFLAGSVFAQVGGPFLGYVPDGSRIRPMIGLPAAGAIGTAYSLGRDFSHIAVSPQQNFLLATAADSGEVMVVKPGTSLSVIKDTGTNPDGLSVSPRGLSAALWFGSSGHLQIVTGLPDATAVRTIDGSFLNESPLAIAVSDDGQWAAGLWSKGVYAFGPNSEVIALQADPGVVAMAFFHNRHDLALATSKRATSIVDIGGSAQQSILFDYADRSLSARAIGVSFDNQRIVIADAAGKLVNIAAANHSASITDCGCSPEGVYGLGGAVFRITGSNRASRGGPRTELKLFDAAAGSVLIVPPAQTEIGGRQ